MTTDRLPAREAARARRCAQALDATRARRRATSRYVVSTGYGRFQVPFRDVQVTDLTAAARGAPASFPDTRTVLDVGGQTMKASRLDDAGEGEARSG